MMSDKLHHPYHLVPTIAVLGVLFSSILITAAYAQPQQQRGPCPEGFSLNRGVCQAEPEVTPGPATCEEGFELVDDMCRTIEPTRFHMAFCPTGHSVAFYTHPEHGFISSCTAIGSHPPFDESEIADPTCDILFKAPNETVVLENYERPVFAHETICAFYEVKEPIHEEGEPTCEVGSLNEDSGMCELKPGRRSK